MASFTRRIARPFAVEQMAAANEPSDVAVHRGTRCPIDVGAFQDTFESCVFLKEGQIERQGELELRHDIFFIGGVKKMS